MAIYFGTSDATRSRGLSREAAAGRIRKIASKIYTDDLRSPPEEVVIRHRFEIAAHFYPGAVITHRSALEGRVSPAGKLHLTVPDAAAPVRSLPGLEIRLWRGPAAQADDIRTPFGEDLRLFIASQPRALLENMQISRAKGGEESKVLADAELERWIDRQIRAFGIRWFDDMRERTKAIAEHLGWDREQQEFEKLLGAFQGRASTYRLATDVARSRAQGRPYDPDRDLLFRNLQTRLAAEAFRDLPAPPVAEFENRAFWEAYFSNFIEGTKFTVDEAQALVFHAEAARQLEKRRPKDAHDIQETHRLIIDPNISASVPKEPEQLIELLRRRHARMMAPRADVEPGVFKKRNNQFGARVFVAPDLVRETLVRGWCIGRELKSATARALYVLFLLAEVHPFIDGNGRISRLGMNAELEAARQARLIIPTSFRTDYLGVLEALTAQGNPEPFISFGHRLIEMNSRMPFGSHEESHAYFRASGALDENVPAINLAVAAADTPGADS